MFGALDRFLGCAVQAKWTANEGVRKREIWIELQSSTQSACGSSNHQRSFFTIEGMLGMLRPRPVFSPVSTFFALFGGQELIFIRPTQLCL